MLKNNLIIAVRTLRKNKVYTAVTFLGLTIGVAASLLLFRMVTYELGFNKNFENYDRIVRVVSDSENGEGDIDYEVCTPGPAMKVIEDRVSQFEAMAKIREFWVTLAQPNPEGGAPLKKFNMEPLETAFFTTPDFFRIFDTEWIQGDPNTALNEPNVIVLTEAYAKKFFGNAEMAMGQRLVMDNLVSVVVKGVVKSYPTNCDFPIPFFSSWETLRAYPDHFFHDEENWGNCSSNNQVYALLHDKNQMEAANTVLAGVGREEYLDSRTGKQDRKHKLQPLSELHFDDRYGHSGSHHTGMGRIRILSGVGLLILIMACFNFINLATAQSSLRAKEVGVRKTLGSSRSQLISQFLSETGLIVICSVLLGLLVATLALPFLQQISNVPEGIALVSDPAVWGYLLILVVSVTILAGLYPSFVLAGFKPIQALRNRVEKNNVGGANVRKSLVVLQFVIAQVLIIGAIVVLMQLNYIRNRDLGFRGELVYTFQVGTDSSSLARQEALKQELLQLPAVESVTFSSDQPLSGNTWVSNFRYGSRPEDENYGVTLKFGDETYNETYGMELASGRWYAKSDTMAEAVINRTLLEKLQIEDAQEVLGKQIRIGSSTMVDIVGVVENFHTHSLRQKHRPLLMTTHRDFYWETGVKIKGQQVDKTVVAMQQAFDKVMPEQVFEGRFLDERIARFYQDDDRLAATSKGFGLLAILISCLGLFGLATHAAQQRVKEIGIRKVLGASTSGIINLLSKDFLKLVLIALGLAIPLAYFLMQGWLEDFAYHTDIKWWIFLLTGLIALIMAFLTVSFQSVRAALMNPIESLRNE